MPGYKDILSYSYMDLKELNSCQISYKSSWSWTLLICATSPAELGHAFAMQSGSRKIRFGFWCWIFSWTLGLPL